MQRLLLCLVAPLAATHITIAPAYAGTQFSVQSDWDQAVNDIGLYGQYEAEFPIGFDVGNGLHYFGGRLIATPQPGGGLFLGLWTGSSQVHLDLEALDPGARIEVHRTRWGPGFINTNPNGGSTAAVYYFPQETYGVSVLFLSSAFGCGSLMVEMESGVIIIYYPPISGSHLSTWGYLSDFTDPIRIMMVENCGASIVGVAGINWAQGPNMGFP